ncbi:MAG: helix-turn-helix transcriptional regulator [Gammaproteobacteria bacterium]|nr:helix-turn-helix transcriptional regulator [Gammaproteobacteria bacterium]
MSAQIIEKNGTPEYAVLPYDEYRALLEKAEIAEDIAAYDEAMRDQSDAIPFEITEALLDGENPLKVWRKYSGMSQAALATLSGTHQSTIAQIESGQRKGSITVLKKLATAMKVDVDDLVV